MQFCQPHWDKLRKAIEDRGMSHLIAKDGQTALENTVADLDAAKQGVDPPKETFDPLMSSFWAINSRALECGGLYLMTQKEDGTDWCPLCELDAHSPADQIPPPYEKHSDSWINGCADSQLAHARKLGLIPEVQ